MIHGEPGETIEHGSKLELLPGVYPWDLVTLSQKHMIVTGAIRDCLWAWCPGTSIAELTDHYEEEFTGEEDEDEREAKFFNILNRHVHEWLWMKGFVEKDEPIMTDDYLSYLWWCVRVYGA